MHRRMSLRKVILLTAGLFLILGLSQCQGRKTVVINKPPPQASPVYKKGSPPPRPEASPVYREDNSPPPWAPAHGQRAKHRYHYYPSSGIYYEQARGVYFYYLNGRWQVSVSLPSTIRINVNEYVYLEMDNDKPYRHHDEVVKRYPPGQMKKKNNDKGKRK